MIYAIDLATGAVELLTLDDFVAAIDTGMMTCKTHEISLDPVRAKPLIDSIRARNLDTQAQQ